LDPGLDASVTVKNVTVGTPGPPEVPELVMLASLPTWAWTKVRTSVPEPSKNGLCRSHDGEQPTIEGGALKLRIAVSVATDSGGTGA
jgi:hypothetical protein